MNPIHIGRFLSDCSSKKDFSFKANQLQNDPERFLSVTLVITATTVTTWDLINLPLSHLPLDKSQTAHATLISFFTLKPGTLPSVLPRKASEAEETPGVLSHMGHSPVVISETFPDNLLFTLWTIHHVTIFVHSNQDRQTEKESAISHSGRLLPLIHFCQDYFGVSVTSVI